MNFSRRHTIGLLGVGLASARFPMVSAAPKKVYDLTPFKVADGLWMIEGATEYFTDENGGAIVNCVLVETQAGIVIVDSGPSKKYGEALLSAANQISGLGVAAVINTHHHPDHFFGNQVFANRPIHALSQTSALAASEGDAFSDNMYQLLGDWMRGTEPVPPNQALESSSLTVGGRTFRLLPLAGHTDADLALIDEKTGVMIAGDLAFLDRAPTTPHADLATWRQSIDYLAGIDVTAILPGHGPLDRNGVSLVQTRDYLNWLEQTLKNAAAEGLDMVEIMQIDLPEEFRKLGAMPQEFHRSVVHLYPEIEKAVMPLGE